MFINNMGIRIVLAFSEMEIQMRGSKLPQNATSLARFQVIYGIRKKLTSVNVA